MRPAWAAWSLGQHGQCRHWGSAGSAGSAGSVGSVVIGAVWAVQAAWSLGERGQRGHWGSAVTVVSVGSVGSAAARGCTEPSAAGGCVVRSGVSEVAPACAEPRPPFAACAPGAGGGARPWPVAALARQPCAIRKSAWRLSRAARVGAPSLRRELALLLGREARCRAPSEAGTAPGRRTCGVGVLCQGSQPGWSSLRFENFSETEDLSLFLFGGQSCCERKRLHTARAAAPQTDRETGFVFPLEA